MNPFGNQGDEVLHRAANFQGPQTPATLFPRYRFDIAGAEGPYIST